MLLHQRFGSLHACACVRVVVLSPTTCIRGPSHFSSPQNSPAISIAAAILVAVVAVPSDTHRCSELSRCCVLCIICMLCRYNLVQVAAFSENDGNQGGGQVTMVGTLPLPASPKLMPPHILGWRIQINCMVIRL